MTRNEPQEHRDTRAAFTAWSETWQGLARRFAESVARAEDLLFVDPHLPGDERGHLLLAEFQTWHELADAVQNLSPPQAARSAHETLLAAFRATAESGDHFTADSLSGDEERMANSIPRLQEVFRDSTRRVAEAYQLVNDASRWIFERTMAPPRPKGPALQQPKPKRRKRPKPQRR